MPVTESLASCAHLAPYYNALLSRGVALVARDLHYVIESDQSWPQGESC